VILQKYYNLVVKLMQLYAIFLSVCEGYEWLQGEVMQSTYQAAVSVTEYCIFLLLDHFFAVSVTSPIKYQRMTCFSKLWLFGRVSVFWDITPCSPFKVNRSFGGTCRFHLQDQTISHHADFLLGMLLDPEDGDDTFLRNVGGLLMHYTALHPRE
jgi:hypothetical protein